jgi:hypothetical protein
MFILIHKFILFIFLVPVWERELPENDTRDKKWIFIEISTIKLIKLGAQMFHSTS